MDAKKHPERILLGTETLIEKLSYNWKRVEKTPTLIGDFCWTVFDYIGEAGLGAWSFTNALENWNWKDCEGKTAVVEVYSTEPTVKLFLNDRLIGKKSPKDCRCTFKCNYEQGTLTAVAYDKAGNETARPYSDISFGQLRQKLYRGRCLVVVRSGTTKGDVEIKVEVDGKETVSCKIEVN